MKRIVLALAVAGLSFPAFALPPPGGTPGTLNVNVTNTVVPVEVSNADPILTRSLDEPAREFVRYTVSVEIEALNAQKLVTTVPAGKRLVIESLTWWASVPTTPTGSQVIFGALRSSQFGTQTYFLQMNPPHPSASSAFLIQDGAQSGPAYFDSGEEIWVSVSKNSGTDVNFNAAINGYLVTL